ncbi:MAG TPA: hypothetical protein VFE57_01840 [Cyclobacteriaceae bacterium]|jgi:hypothetical protein|nr:hypothetical protein [Cyclobacteriaceae bacterium]
MNTKPSKSKKIYVKELKDEDTSKWYDASKPLNLNQLISISKKKSKERVAK